MPRATVSTEAELFELKSCEGGWVKLRRMSYGQRLHRQDMAMQMSVQSDSRNKTATMEVTPTQTLVSQFELKTCVVEHNLEDEEGRTLNFNSDIDFALLDGRIGEEIGQYIDDMHNWDVVLPNSGTRYAQGSGKPEELKDGKVLPRGAKAKSSE